MEKNQGHDDTYLHNSISKMRCYSVAPDNISMWRIVMKKSDSCSKFDSIKDERWIQSFIGSPFVIIRSEIIKASLQGMGINIT